MTGIHGTKSYDINKNRMFWEQCGATHALTEKLSEAIRAGFLEGVMRLERGGVSQVEMITMSKDAEV
jgi:hypothetical protein